MIAVGNYLWVKTSCTVFQPLLGILLRNTFVVNQRIHITSTNEWQLFWPLFRQTTFMCIPVWCTTYIAMLTAMWWWSYGNATQHNLCAADDSHAHNGHVQYTNCSKQRHTCTRTYVCTSHTHTHTHCVQDGRGWDMHTRVMLQSSPFYLPDQRVGARLLHFVQKLRTFRHKTGRLQSRWETGKTQTNQTSYGDSLLTHRATLLYEVAYIYESFQERRCLNVLSHRARAPTPSLAPDSG